MQRSNNIYKAWLDSCLKAEIPAISIDTAARLLAIVCRCGNNENFVYNAKLTVDLEYICEKWNIKGGETPSADIIPLIQQYSNEIEQSFEEFTKSKSKFFDGLNSWIPEWCCVFIKERYGFDLYKKE